MVRTRDDKLAYFAKLKDLIETYRKLPPFCLNLQRFEREKQCRKQRKFKEAKNRS